jgi:hypothetical protein
MDSVTGGIRDKYLAAGASGSLLLCYMVLSFAGRETAFMENALLFMLGVFGGLLKQSAAPQTNVNAEQGTTNVIQKPE